MKKIITICTMYLIASSLYAQKADSSEADKNVVGSRQPVSGGSQSISQAGGCLIHAPKNTVTVSIHKDLNVIPAQTTIKIGEIKTADVNTKPEFEKEKEQDTLIPVKQ